MLITIKRWNSSDLESDAEALSAILSNKRVTDRLRDGLPFPYTVSDGIEYISAMLSADPNDCFSFAVTADGKTVGNVSAFRQGNIHSRTAEFGYYLAEEYHGRGIMTEAVGLLCEYVFTNTDILRIYAEPFSDNLGSCRVLEKSGFVCEGTLRQNAVKNDIVKDMKLYSLLASDFARSK